MLLEVTAHGLRDQAGQFDPATQYVSMVYFRQNVYVDCIPHILFQPEAVNFVETKATIKTTCDTPGDELASAQNEFAYVIVNAVQSPKKGKKPADDVSYPELVLMPAFAYAEIPLRDLMDPSALVPPSDGGDGSDSPTHTYFIEKKTVPLIFSTSFSSGLSANIVVSIKFIVPNHAFYDLHKIEPVLPNVEIMGSFTNLGKVSHTVLPAFGWSLSLYLPGLPDTPFATVRNGYLVSTETEAARPQSIDVLEDVIAISATKCYHIVFPDYWLLCDQDAISTGLSTVSQLASIGEKPGAKGGVDSQAITTTVISMLVDCYHMGVPAAMLDKKADPKKKAPEPPKQEGTTSASYGGVTFNDTYNALRELLQITYTNSILKHYEEVEKEIAAATGNDSATNGAGTKGGKPQKPSHPSLDPKNQVKRITMTVEAPSDFLRFPLFIEKKQNTRQVFYLSTKAFQTMRSVILAGSDSCCKLVLSLEALPDGQLLNCLIGSSARARGSIGGAAETDLAMSPESFICESYIDMRSLLTDAEIAVPLLEQADGNEEHIPLCNQPIVVSFSNEPFTYTEDTAALINEQIAAARAQIDALPVGAIPKTDQASLQAKLNSNFGIMVHPIITNIARPTGHMDITNTPILQDYDTILERLRGKIIPITALLPRLRDGFNSIDDYVIAPSDFMKRLFTDRVLPPAQEKGPVDQIILKFKDNVRKLFLERSIQGTAADSFNAINQSLNSPSEIGADEAMLVERKKVTATVDHLLTKYVREFKDMYTKLKLPPMSVDALHHKLVCAAKETYSEAKQKQRRPEELLEYGNALLYSKARHEAVRAINLYSAALVRERQRRQRGEHSMVIEYAIEGLLRAFIYSRNKVGISRSLLRVFGIPFLHNPITNETGVVFLSRLVLLTCHELMAAGEDEYLILSLLYCSKDLFNFSFTVGTDKVAVAERIFLKVACMNLLKALNFLAEYSELKVLLLRKIREACVQNDSLPVLSLPANAHDKGSTTYVSDDYILTALRLALAEYLLLEGSVTSTQKLITQTEIPTHLSADQYTSLITKKTIILARCAILEGRLGDAKSLLLRDIFLTTKGNGDFNPYVLFQDLQGSPDEISVSYLDLLNQSLDINTPGLLGHLALIGAMTHQLPAIFSILNRDLAKFAVAHAIQGDFSNLVPPSSWTAPGAGKQHVHARLGETKAMALQESLMSVIPEHTMVSPVLLNDVRALTFTTVIFNSRVSMDMLLQMHTMSSSIVNPPIYYGGLLDCLTLTGFNLYEDTYICRIMLGLCARHIPAQDCMPFVVPFERPSEDEFAVAAKVFESIRLNLDGEADDPARSVTQHGGSLGSVSRAKDTDFYDGSPGFPLTGIRYNARSASPLVGEFSQNYCNKHVSIAGSFTSDYLGMSLPQTVQGVVQLAEAISMKVITRSASAISANYFSSEILGIVGIIMFYAGKQDHLKVLTRAAELDAFSFPSWCGLALSLSSMIARHVSGRVHKYSLDQVRSKIVECTSRMLDVAASMNIAPFTYASIAIAQSLLDTMAEETTILSQTALKLIEKVRSDIPLIPICVNTSKVFKTYFFAGASLQSSWFVHRLKALAYVSCGTLVDVADAYLAALKGIGGILPGCSVAEIAERVLLMAETSYSYEACNRIKDAEDVMNNGLTKIK